MDRTMPFRAILVAALAVYAAPTTGAVTDAELHCQVGTAKAMGVFSKAVGKCEIKCQQGARKGKNLITDCTAGNYAGATAACVDAARTKAASGEVKSCIPDCPECYDGDGACAPGDCACDADELTEEVEDAINLYVGFLYCTEPNELTVAEQKCQDSATKILSKMVAAHLKCFQKCHDLEQKGKLPAGSCTLPVSEPATQACLATATTKAAVAIDKVCEPNGGDRPECFTFDGTGWATTIGSVVDGYDPEFFCGSPSAAFVGAD